MPPPFQAAVPQLPPPIPREKPALVLTVEYGDSVGGIAQRYGVTATAIIVLNELSHPYWLHTGQQLALPRADFAVARRDEPPAEASRYSNGEPAIAVAEIEAEPATPARVEPEEHAHAEYYCARSANPRDARSASRGGAHAADPGGARGARTADPDGA